MVLRVSPEKLVLTQYKHVWYKAPIPQTFWIPGHQVDCGLSLYSWIDSGHLCHLLIIPLSFWRLLSSVLFMSVFFNALFFYFFSLSSLLPHLRNILHIFASLLQRVLFFIYLLHYLLLTKFLQWKTATWGCEWINPEKAVSRTTMKQIQRQ